MNKFLLLHTDKLKQIFKTHQIKKAYLFGLVIQPTFNKDSDVDFLIQFEENLPPLKKGELWWSLHDTLRDLLKREIDIVTETSLKNPYFIKELNQTKKLIYG